MIKTFLESIFKAESSHLYKTGERVEIAFLITLYYMVRANAV
jgi:hypothetical protein